jgi:nucleoside-diphosphate-sugar epimerase
MRVLVTGASGFIGSHLVARLVSEGHSVRTLVRDARKAHEVLPDSVELVFGDMRDPASLERAVVDIEVIYHAAAHVTDWGPWADFEAVTVRGTRMLVDAAARAGVRRFALLSSSAVYSEAAVRSGHVTEDAPLTTDASAGNRYGYAKALAEQHAFAYHTAGKLEVTAIRPAWVYGPGDRSLLPRTLQFLRDPSSAWIAGHNHEVGLVYVTDGVDALVRAAETPAAAGLAFNVSAIESYTLRDFANQMASHADIHVPTRTVPLWLARVVAALAQDTARLLRRKSPPSLTRTALAIMLEGNPYDVTRARSVLGWEPRVSAERGIEQMMNWAQSVGMV